ncbi:MAG TPA: hypothetical protein VJ731_03030 [Terriglobales bacterium]|nr:hypothetical protein [Terriglobales bacterium]
MKTRFFQVGLVLLLMASAVTMSAAQLNATAQTIALKATLNESLTLSLSANAVNFTLAAGAASNPGSTNITATTSWVLQPGRTAVGLYAYFTSATAALTDGANNIPSSAFFISDNGGASAALTNSVGFGATNAGLQLANVNITGANKNSSRTDAMAFNINLTSLPQLPASTYTGTLNIQAQATP